MALRVLLADESSTIKKVIQLALQDFAVEVKVVPNGLDVVEVARKLQPDIAFVDVLLTQRSGYDVSLELKANAETSRIPVIVMWSGFMAVDEARFRASRADDRLEKPFDTEHLRHLINKWVPRAAQNSMSQFMQFPKMPDFIQNEDAEDFAHVPLKKNKDAADEGWQHHSIKNNDREAMSGNRLIDSKPPEFGFTLDSGNNSGWDQGGKSNPPGGFQTPPLPPNYPRNERSEIPEVPIEDLKFDEFRSNSSNGDDNDMPSSYEEVSFDISGGNPGEITSQQVGPATQSLMHEKIIREEARRVIENIAWKILPDLAERILREEIDKILRDEERKFQP